MYWSEQNKQQLSILHITPTWPEYMTLQWTTAYKRRYSLHPNSISYNGSPFLKNQPTPTKSYNVQNLPSWLHFLIHMVNSTSDYWEWKLTHFLIQFRPVYGDCFLGATTSVFSSLKPQVRRESETGRGIEHIIYTNATLMGTVEFSQWWLCWKLESIKQIIQ